MLIISKFKDYYDGVGGSMGVDKKIVYVRQQKIINKTDKDFPERFKYKGFKERLKSNDIFQHISYFSYNGYYDFRKKLNLILIYPFLIGFCGKYYLGWKKTTQSSVNITYNYNDVKEYVNEERNLFFRSINIYDFMKNIENMDDISFFRKYNTPVFVVDYSSEKRKVENKFIINPILKEYNFYKIFDSYTAFQEIQMFIGGVLSNNENDNIIEINDKHKIEQHGFDYKWSFRKEPTKKNKRNL